ncbi:MAG TPA: nucleotidyl transferase AbiEii/AbiGii toxin family protein [Edaphobacter sp.]|uniref:nucleotidyl transferase AbiEii/AbiGii toxin family protein n=1 Tax=Edaphobacter sp. TaxID=1934404 RepID=UPI002C4A8CFE|nr:nucleotidyl transferase AbiEii/AbiGii toxin family protein [Edaphobacter sp.]HUZ95042.1 nucleotidyl transferase AbiEii/AbiGii toxin family protein [Edaphobacter sp.]
MLSNRLAKQGGRRIREDVLERDYCLAWFLAALGESDLRTSLALKGGTALKRCYFGDYRFSEDLDFTLLEANPFDDILRRMERVYEAVRESSGIVFAFDREDRQTHANSYTFYLSYTGPLPVGNDVKVDITVRERLVFPVEQRLLLRGYDEFTDLPEDRRVQAYSLQEIVVEKIIALADPARNEPRDLYDLWYLTTNEAIEIDHLADPIRRKLEFRERPFADLEDAILGKGARLKALWSRRLAYQMSTLPPFDEVFRSLRRTLRRSNLP